MPNSKISCVKKRANFLIQYFLQRRKNG